MAGANRYLRDRFLAAHDGWFAHHLADPTPASVPLGRVDLGQILCPEEPRVVGRDNTLRLDGVLLQIAKQRGRRTCAGFTWPFGAISTVGTRCGGAVAG